MFGGIGCSTKTTSTPAITATATSISSATPSKANTPQPTATSRPTATVKPTITPQPAVPSDKVLSVDQANDLILTLLQDNPDCRLPCWWGCTPGETTWDTVYPFLLSLDSIADIEDVDAKIGRYRIAAEIPADNLELRQIYKVKENTVNLIWIAGITLSPSAPESTFLQHHRLPQILQTYGQPDEVLIQTYASSPESPNIFRLMLFYRRGIFLIYNVDILQSQETLRACFEESNVAMWLWHPAHYHSVEDLINSPNLNRDIIEPALPLEQATGMSIKTFMGTFTKPKNSLCLETPQALW